MHGRWQLAMVVMTFAMSVSSAAFADTPRNSPIVSDSDPRLIGSYRASGQYITTAPCQTLPCSGPTPGAAGTREVPLVKPRASEGGGSSLVTRVKDALMEPVPLPPLVNAAISMPLVWGKGFASQALDAVTGTVGFVANTDAAIARSVAGLATGNLGAAERAATGSQVAQMVEMTVRGTTTTVRAVTAYATNNDVALINALREAPMTPLVLQASEEAPRIVNTILSGSLDERVRLAQQGAELHGRISLEALLMATPGGGAARAPTLAVRTTTHLDDIARVSGAGTERVGTRPSHAGGELAQEGERASLHDASDGAPGGLSASDRAWSVEQLSSPGYTRSLEEKLDQLVASRNKAEKLMLMSELSTKTNILHALCEVGRGNCAFVTGNNADMFSTGRLSMPYQYAAGDRPVNAGTVARQLRGNGYVGLIPPKMPPGPRGRGQTFAELKPELDRLLSDGEMATFSSRASGGGHAVLIVKADGNYYVINNQGWRDGAVELLESWMDHWASLHPDDPNVGGIFFPTGRKVAGWP